jgi:cytochrome c553
MIALVLLMACAPEPAATCVVDSGGWRPTWSNFGESWFVTWCASCHAADAPQRFGAPEALVFDTEAQVKNSLSIIRSSVLGGSPTMPVGGGLPEEDRQALERYLDCLEAK